MEAVNSITDLRNLVGINSTSIVQVLGYYEPGDGGGGLFYWDESSIEEDNTGTIIEPNLPVTNGRWIRDFSGSVNVKWFGAKGDGNTNDYASITAAITYSSANYLKLRLPASEYRINTPIDIKSLSILVGDGLDATVIRYYGSSGSALNFSGLINAPIVKCRVEDLSIFNHGSGNNGLFLNYCLYCMFKNIRVYGFVVGIAVSNSWNNDFNFCICDFNTQDGINLSTTDANALNFNSCQSVNNARSGLFTSGGRAVTFNGCTFETNGSYGVFISGGADYRPLNYTFTGCYIEGNTEFEILIQSGTTYIPYGITIRDCYFEFISGKAELAIRVVNVNGLVVDGCTFDDQDGAYTNSIYLSTGSTIKGVVWGYNTDSSVSGVYSEVVYRNLNKQLAVAQGNFTVASSVITSVNAFGIAGIVRISAGVFEVTLSEELPDLFYTVICSAINPATTYTYTASPTSPISKTTFSILTGALSSTPADPERVTFVVYK